MVSSLTGKSRKTLMVAEIGMNHDGSFGNALRMIDAASACGVDAVKFQTHIPEAETLPDAPSPPYFKEESRFEYFRRTAFSISQWRKLKEHCESKGVTFISSSFSKEAVDLLEKIGTQVFKIPSGEVTNIPYIEYVASKNKPVLLSTGMSTWSEIDDAVKTILRHHSKLTLLQCTSVYPCPYEEVGLDIMLEMKKRYGLPVGLSDHTLTNYAAFAAVVMGATVIEKHFTLSRYMYGSDAAHSIEPNELSDLVRGVRAIETMLASKVNKDDVSRLSEMKKIFQKSLVSLVDIPAGSVIKEEMIGVKKPGTGIPPRRYREVVGRRTTTNIRANQVLLESYIDWTT